MPDSAIPTGGEPTTPGRPPIVVCADDYGASAATSAVIRQLLAAGRINATTCLVEAGAWAAEAEALRDLGEAHQTVAIGLHLNLTEALANSSDASVIAPIASHIARAALPVRLQYVNAVHAAFRAQWDAFVDGFGRAPDFLDGHEHVHLFPAPRRAVFRLAAETGFAGWVRQCQTTSPRPGLKRLILDPLSLGFAREARARGLMTNPGFGGLRRFDPAEDVASLWRADIAAMADGGLLMVHPGAAAADRAGLCRDQEARLLAELDLGVARDARRPWRG
jgi:predicted glycoside hydrolase/deacetylase ChbG (UPF0249 family)